MPAPSGGTESGSNLSAPRLSVTVITKNEAHRIVRCLRSVAFADECIVVDSGSTDGTVELARTAGARVEVTPDWPGFGPQKNRALALARGEWVLSIDADEEVTPALRDAILAVVGGAPARPDLSAPVLIQGVEPERTGPSEREAPPVLNGYWITRSSSFCGQRIRHGDWRNDRVLRLFRRDIARFSDEPVHERVECPGPHGQLPGVLLHDSVDSIADAVEKTERYARLGAEKLRGRGRGGPWSAVLHAGWTFVRGYLVRLGFLDGGAGFAIARLNARGTYLKYRLAGAPRAADRAEDQPQGD